jgi:hypothetical protein
LGLLQGWLDVRAIGHFIAVVLHLGRTYFVGLLFVNLYFYIFNQQRFRADTAAIPALQASPARWQKCGSDPTKISHFKNTSTKLCKFEQK